MVMGSWDLLSGPSCKWHDLGRCRVPTLPCAPWQVQISSLPCPHGPSVRPLLGFTRMALRSRAAPPILLGPHCPHQSVTTTTMLKCSRCSPIPPTGPSILQPRLASFYADAALTRCGPARPSMSSATAAQRAHAALLVPGGHGMAAADVLRTGEKIPENPGNDVVCHRS